MTQKQNEILKSIEQEFNRINAQEVLETNDLIAQIENRVDGKRKLRLELEVLDKINKLAIKDTKDRIVDKLKPVVSKYGFRLEERDAFKSDYFYGIRIICVGCKLRDMGSDIEIDGYIRAITVQTDSILHVKSPTPRFETKYMLNCAPSEDALINHFVDGIVNALKTRV